MIELYTDGGVIGRNPSPLGGTWAWVLVESGKQVDFASGIVTPEDMGVSSITNNQTELLAALKALEYVGKDWSGVLHTDSQVTLFRITTSHKFNNIPEWMTKRVLECRKGRRWQACLVGGHATRQEIRDGKLRRNGLPTSVWNSFCDKECQRLARNVLGKKKPKVREPP